MSARRARILRPGRDGAEAVPVVVVEPSAASRVALSRVVKSEEQAAALRARELVAAAEASTQRLREDLETQAEERAKTSLAAAYLDLAERERALIDAGPERVLELGRLLAERLLGAELRLSPERVADLAREVVAASAGARELRVLAHADDVAELEAALPSLSRSARSLRVERGADLARGDVVLETEAGRVDGRLRVRLERLLEVLRREEGP